MKATTLTPPSPAPSGRHGKARHYRAGSGGISGPSPAGTALRCPSTPSRTRLSIGRVPKWNVSAIAGTRNSPVFWILPLTPLASRFCRENLRNFMIPLDRGEGVYQVLNRTSRSPVPSSLAAKSRKLRTGNRELATGTRHPAPGTAHLEKIVGTALQCRRAGCGVLLGITP